MPRLAQNYRVITPDLPGSGGSDPLPANTIERTAAMGEAVGALIDRCGTTVRLCGHSYGGNVALHAAIARRKCVENVVLFEPVLFRALQLTGDHHVLAHAVRFFSDYAERVKGGEPGAVGDMIDYWFGAGSFAQMHPSARKFLIARATANGVDVQAAFAERLAIDQLASFTTPVLVAYGGSSPPAAQAIAAALVQILPKARSHVVPGATHGMIDSHPDALADLVIAAEAMSG